MASNLPGELATGGGCGCGGSGAGAGDATARGGGPAIHIAQFRPLPDEILRMGEEETACRYCGISYLLLTKYESMEKHVKEVDAEMARLKKYVEERPQMLARLESLLELQKRLEQDRQIAEAGMKDWQARARKEADAAERAMAAVGERDRELERLVRAARERDAQDELRAAAWLRGATNARYEVIQMQNDLAKLKGFVKSSMSSVLLSTTTAASKQLAGHFAAAKERAVAEALQRADKKSSSVVGSLRNEVQALKDSLSESQKRSERLAAELAAFRHDYSTHIEGQRSYTSDLQANCLALEERLHDANKTLPESATSSTQNEASFNLISINKYATFELPRAKCVLLTSNILQIEHDKRVAELVQEREAQARATSSPALSQAHQAMAKKDEQMMQMERTIRELNASIASMRNERIKTIEAHQNRIKQLQDRFVEDIKSAGRQEAARVEAELRRAFAEDKDEALQQLRRSMKQEFDEAKLKLQHQIDALKAAADASRSAEIRRIEDEWSRRNSSLQDQLVKLQRLNQEECSQLQQNIASLEKELIAANAALRSHGTSAERDTIAQLKSDVAKRDAEISFLKDTVRLECEERMADAFPKEARSFEILVQAAFAKKERKLSKQSSVRRVLS
ncbi:hypothetical protein HK105_202111 [Polyrhizophydium stewartii]|uniref:Uncharacterized protein n=1 Tax=Polyrhizophydium stewartii TaxID=2732419 RepID=A0ABR4NFF7_9FUNG